MHIIKYFTRVQNVSVNITYNIKYNEIHLEVKVYEVCTIIL